MTTPDRPGTTSELSENDAQWRSAGERIQTLLDSCAAGGAAAYDRAQLLVREVIELYGAGLARIMGLAGDPGFAERLATDDLVASLLLVHGLHPHDVRRRVCDALDRVRPYLGSHGGDVDLIGIDGDTVRLAFTGSCKSCPSSAVTLELAVQDAILTAAPEICTIEVAAAAPAAGTIPAESLLAQVRSRGTGATAWRPAPELAELAPGEVAGFSVDGTTLLACRVGDRLFAYRDHCPVCDDTLAGARLHAGMLECPRCTTEFDAVHAGAGTNGTHLQPIPVLLRDGALSVALRGEPLGAGI